MKIEIQDDNTITLDGVKYVRVGEPAECEKDVVTTTTPLIDEHGRYLTEPEAGTPTWLLCDDGVAPLYTWTTASSYSSDFLAQGSVFATEESAIREAAVRAAWQRIRKWKAENAPFVPDWSDSRQVKHFAGYDHKSKKWFLTSHRTTIRPLGVPVFFGPYDDIRRCHRECESDWSIIAGLDAGEAK